MPPVTGLGLLVKTVRDPAVAWFSKMTQASPPAPLGVLTKFWTIPEVLVMPTPLISRGYPWLKPAPVGVIV